MNFLSIDHQQNPINATIVLFSENPVIKMIDTRITRIVLYSMLNWSLGDGAIIQDGGREFKIVFPPQGYITDCL